MERSAEAKIALINGLSDLVETLYKKINGSDFLVNMIKSFFDETLLSDLENISEFLIDIKTEQKSMSYIEDSERRSGKTGFNVCA